MELDNTGVPGGLDGAEIFCPLETWGVLGAIEGGRDPKFPGPMLDLDCFEIKKCKVNTKNENVIINKNQQKHKI